MNALIPRTLATKVSYKHHEYCTGLHTTLGYLELATSKALNLDDPETTRV
jgi:hypothetical protein